MFTSFNLSLPHSQMNCRKSKNKIYHLTFHCLLHTYVQFVRFACLLRMERSSCMIGSRCRIFDQTRLRCYGRHQTAWHRQPCTTNSDNPSTTTSITACL